VASVSSTYITIVGDFTAFRTETRRQARLAGEDAAQGFARNFRNALRAEMAGARMDFNVRPILDLTAFRNQYRLFRQVYLQDQSFLVNPVLNDAMLRAAFLGLANAGRSAGDRAGNEAGKGFNTALLKMLAGAAGVALLGKSLLGIVSVLGELVVMFGAVGAAIPAMAVTGIAAMATFKLALSGVGDAVKEAFTGDDPEKLAEALDKLAPPARRFVLEMLKFKPQLKGLQQDVQASFFQPMLGGFAALMRSPALGLVRNLFKGIATDAGTAGAGILGVLTATAKSGELAAVFEPIRRILKEFFSTGPGLVQTLITLARVGGKFAEILLSNVAFSLQRFVDLIATAAADGSLAEFFERGLDIMSVFGELLGDIFSILGSIFGALQSEGESTLGVIGSLVDMLADFLKTAEGSAALSTLAQILGVLGDVVGAVLKPLLPVVAKLVQVLGGPLVASIAALTPILGILITAMADMLMPVIDALAPIISELAAIVARFLSAAMAELAIHIQTLAPVAALLAEQLGPELIPVVTALGQVLLALVPIIPAISEAIISLLPLLEELLPLFVEQIQVTAVIITWIAQLISWLVKMGAAYLETVGVVAGQVARWVGVMRDMWNEIRDRYLAPMLDTLTNKIPHAFRTGVDLIEFWWNRLKGVASEPVRFFVETVVNRGIIGTFNRVADWIPGLGKLPPVPGFHDGGSFSGMLPGAPSDVDNMLAASPYGPIALASGEFVVKSKEANRPLAKQILQFINDGGLRGFAGGGFIDALMNPVGWVKDSVGNVLDRIPGGGRMVDVVRGFGSKILNGLIAFVKDKRSFLGAGGAAAAGFPPWPASPGASRGDSGVWRAIVGLIRGTGPVSGSFGNAYRHGDPLWHGSGRAVDWMGFNQDALAMFFMNMKGHVLELIHRTNNRDYAITRGRDRGKFNETLMNQHRNHIHIAMAEGGWLPRMLAGVTRLMDTGGWMMPGWNPPTFNGTGKPEAVIPDGMSVALDDETIEKLARAFMRAMSAGLGAARQVSRSYA